MRKVTIKDSIKTTVDRLPKKTVNEGQLTSKAYGFLLYEDTEDYNIKEIIKALNEYVANKNGSYAYILHDRDTYSQDDFNEVYKYEHKVGEAKKNHYHYIMILPYYVPMSDVALAVGLDERFIKIIKPKSIKSSLCYLNHSNAPTKYQYPFTKIVTDIPQYISNCIENQHNGILLYKAIDYLKATEKPHVTYTDIINNYLESSPDINQIRVYHSVVKQLVEDYNNSEKIGNRINTEYERAKFMKELEQEKKELDAKMKILNSFFDEVDIMGDKQYFLHKGE